MEIASKLTLVAKTHSKHYIQCLIICFRPSTTILASYQQVILRPPRYIAHVHWCSVASGGIDAGFVELTTALAVEYYWDVNQGLPVAVGLPFTSYFLRNRR